MKKFSRIIIAITAFLLVFAIFVSAEPLQLASAAVGQDVALSKKYLSEVKMFYGRTENDAKADCEKEGFTFCPANLNEGAPNVIRDGDLSEDPVAPMGIYMGYKTTEDPGDAITDITLLDMKNTHFTEIDYKKYLDEHISEFKDEAARMMVLVGELKRQLDAGSPNAQMVYNSLNLIYVDENKAHDAEDNLLGYYLLNMADIPFFEKFIQRGHSMVVGRVSDLLCGAASDYNKDGTTWVDRSKTSEIAVTYANSTSADKNMYDQQYQDLSKRFVKAIRDFKDTYTEAKRRRDQYGDTLGYNELKGMTEENGAEKLSQAGAGCRFPEYSDALKTYALLESIPYHKAGEKVVNNAALLVDEDTGDEETGEEGTEADFPSTGELFKDKDGKELESISIYRGINRGIFRNDVALTDKARTQQNLGNNPYNDIWGDGGIAETSFYVGLGVGSISLIAGLGMYIYNTHDEYIYDLMKNSIKNEAPDSLSTLSKGEVLSPVLEEAQMNRSLTTNKLITAGKWLAGIGGALILISIAVKGVQLYKDYHRDFTKIPNMIVDESNIVTHTKDKNGKGVKNINFDQFAYYEVAKCNRQEIGINKDAQSGVSDYASWGCGDAADLNADTGREWLALYVNRAGEKGKPILADSLILKTGFGSEKTPADRNGFLHMFTRADTPVKIDNIAFCYNDDFNGMYLYWNTDANAYTASAFNGGTLALVGIGGLALGIVGTTLVFLPKLKKKKEEEIAV